MGFFQSHFGPNTSTQSDQFGSHFGGPTGGGGGDESLPRNAIVNLNPPPEGVDSGVLEHIRYSVRMNGGTDINSIRMISGYADIFSKGDQEFDVLEGTRRIPLLSPSAGEPDISLVTNGVQIAKTIDNPQRSVYVTSIPQPDDRFASTLLSVQLSPGAAGTIFGIEHGPRNKVIYFTFEDNSGKRIRVNSYFVQTGSPIVDTTIVFNWAGFRRYNLIWNEVDGNIELFADINGNTTSLFSTNISSIPDMPDGYFARADQALNICGIYGQTGPTGSTSIWKNVAFTTNVAIPLVGIIRPGEFTTTLTSADIIRTYGNTDPTNQDSSWFLAPSSLLPFQDSQGFAGVVNGAFNVTKPTQNTTFAFYREEPGLSTIEGFMIEAGIDCGATKLVSAATGTGFTVFDGVSVFQVQLFDYGDRRTIGILKKGGFENDVASYFTPPTDFNWTGGRRFRLAVDTVANRIRIFDMEDVINPIMDILLDRGALPNGPDKGWTSLNPFVMFGHTIHINTAGTFILHDIAINHIHDAWEGFDGQLPQDYGVPGSYGKVGSDSPTMVNNQLVITSSVYGPTSALFNREVPSGTARGAIIEASVQITSWRDKSPTGVVMGFSLPGRSIFLTFDDTYTGKYATIYLGSDNKTGRDGDAVNFSFLVDWTISHTYRLEYQPFDGLRVYIDNELSPRLHLPIERIAELPVTKLDIFLSNNPLIVWGNAGPAKAVSKWDFVRGFYSNGYEVVAQINEDLLATEVDLSNTQAIVIVVAQDIQEE